MTTARPLGPALSPQAGRGGERLPLPQAGEGQGEGGVGALLSIEHLSVAFGATRVVDDVSFAVAPGEKFGLVGESGSGKSITALSVLRLVDAATTSGTIRFAGADLTTKSEREMRGLRGAEIAMIFQEPMTALNPLYTVGDQIAEVLELHEGLRRNAARARAIELLAKTGIPDPAERVDAYAHQLSGGQRQRAMIAIALACRPKLLIADEPTTALDVTIQAQVLELISDIREKLGMSVVLITHDLGIVAEHCDRVMVMYAGQVVEEGPTAQVIGSPSHPYTRGLLGSIPRLSMRGQPIHPIEGQVPDLIDLPPQCRFYSRCTERTQACLAPVAMHEASAGHRARCIRVAEQRR